MNIRATIFSEEEVRATLDGTKTLIISPLKPAPVFQDGFWRWYTCTWKNGGLGFPESGIEDYAPYLPGDFVWVKERWRTIFSHPLRYLYQADAESAINERTGLPIQWSPANVMTLSAARLWLRINDVRAMRLQDHFPNTGAAILNYREYGMPLPEECVDCIETYDYPCCSDLDANRPVDESSGVDSAGGSECGMLDDIRAECMEAWDRRFKATELPVFGWDANPWVWLISYKRCEKP